MIPSGTRETGAGRTYFVLKYVRMKDRVTLTLDPAVSLRAKRLARERGTSVSALVEEHLRTTPLAGEQEGSFVDRWTGRFRIAKGRPGDRRMRALKAKFGLDGR
jgi:hypothetical protein